MSASKRVRWPLAVALIAVGSLALWFTFESDEPRTREREPAEAADQMIESEHAHVLAESAERASAPTAGGKPSPSVQVPMPEPPAVAGSSHRVVGPGPRDLHEPGMVPHPLDEAHERIAAENRLIQALNDAMSFHKVEEMRDMLVKYREIDPEDVDKHQLGYEVIADCIEFPGNASLTAAREFYDTQRHSPLRRFVRRICFENSK